MGGGRNTHNPTLQWRSQGDGGGRPPPPRFRRRKKRKISCVYVKLPSFNHFLRLNYKFVLYEELTGHMHQIAPLTTSKCKKLSPSLAPLTRARSLRPLAGYFCRPPKIKFWLRHCHPFSKMKLNAQNSLKQAPRAYQVKLNARNWKCHARL